MKNGDTLLALLDVWRTISEKECTAIRCRAWEEIAQHQKQKEQLQGQITQELSRLRSMEPAAAEGCWRGPVDGLIDLEKRNRDMLLEMRARKTAELDLAKASSRNLRAVRRAYGGSGEAVWQSYS